MADRLQTTTRLLASLLAPVLPAKFKDVARVLAERPAPTPSGWRAVAADRALTNLEKVDHLVVLMLENRSFDHMLGYLSLLGGRSDIDGLSGSEANRYDGREYHVHHLTRTALDGELEDPCHSPDCVDEQLSGGNGGFVSNYAKYAARYRATHPGAPAADPGLVMGYYTDAELPVYDYLAREFCVCDRWFSSVPGATWPNRLYSLTGRAAGSRDDAPVPLYNLPSFVRFLDQRGVGWRWYSYDPGTLRFVDAEYRLTHHDRFSLVDQRKIAAVARLTGDVLGEESSFLEDAAHGALPSISWIDPHFKDPRVFGPDSDDDHPPGDVLAGQALVLDIYHALRSSPAWERTALVVLYDEHGGLYDHVPPPPADDDDPGFRRYGVRVPAFVVSPWVRRGSVAPRQPVLDHTSIIKTILLRFCCDCDRIPSMGTRVDRAHDLGGLLDLDAPRTDIAPHDDIARRITAWRTAFDDRYSGTPPGHPQPLTDLQQRFVTGARLLRAAGLPAGHP